MGLCAHLKLALSTGQIGRPLPPLHADAPCGAPGRLQVFLRAGNLLVTQPHLLERREPSPVRLAGVPEAPRVHEVQLLEGRGQRRHELHDVHFQVGVDAQEQTLEARAQRQHLSDESRPLLQRTSF